MTSPNNAKYVWTDNTGKGRNLYAQFRRSFDVQGRAEKARIHVFADTAYQIFVNGVFVTYGPVRFDPRYPMYDTVELGPYLRQGRNVIAILVNSFQMKTYKSIANRAGLIAWGSVETEAGLAIPLETGREIWKCKEAGAYSHYMPKMSFALNPIDIYDQAGEDPEWKTAAFDDSDWQSDVVLKDQDSWGPLEERTIPLMSLEEAAVEKVRRIAPLENREGVFSFSVPVPHHYEDDSDNYSNFIAFSSFIYSPQDQVVNAGVFWGEFWLNGVELPRGLDCINYNMRITQPWPLKQGWNEIFGKVGAYQDIMDFYLALPLDRGLKISADRDDYSPAFFRYTPEITKEEYEKFIEPKGLPLSASDPLSEIGGWKVAERRASAQNPVREAAWDDYGDPIESLTPDELQGHVFSHDKYPGGFAIMLDLGMTRLVIPEIELEGVNDAKVDLLYSEHLCKDGYRLLQSHNYQGGDRILCSRNHLKWMPSHPRGMRYLTIIVRNTLLDVTLKSLKLRLGQYPVENVGRFACSDATLNAVWEMGRLTQATNMEDAYVDCVGRERGMYGRDTIIQYHVNLATFGDHALMGRCMQLYGQSPDSTGKIRAVFPNTGNYTITDFCLDMVTGYRNYYEWSGDLDRAKNDWDTIMNNLAWFHELADERDDLLLDSEWYKRRKINAHYKGFHGDLDTLMDKTGVHCNFSCTYLYAMRSAIFLGEAMGKDSELEDLKRRVSILEKSIPEKYWDDEKQCLADNLDRTSHSPHSNLYAFIADVDFTPEQAEACKAHIANSMQHVFMNGYDPSGKCIMSPSYAFYLFQGLYKTGLTDVAENLMRQGWGWALAQGLPQCPEYFDLRRSLCHAWSAAPTYYLSRHVLGVHYPKAPDFSRVDIRVETNDIDWAEGVWPHPAGGEVEVKWHMEKGKRVFNVAKAPEGVEINIVG
ncbi:MAG: alpha-L-rhamnosidase N-terminal domain-containing protein [Candidatus Sumerlaeia bacterium]